VLAGLVTAVGGAPAATAGVSPGVADLVSVRSDGTPAQDSSFDPAISADGRFVVLSSSEPLDTDALPADTPSSQVFVRDLAAGRTRLLTLTYDLGDGEPGEPGEPAGPRARPADGHSRFPSISADGRYVAIETTASLAGLFPNDLSKIVLIDRDPDGDGELDEPVGSTIALSYSLLSENDADPVPAVRPSISAGGGVVVYEENQDGATRLAVSTRTPGGLFERRVLYPQQPGLVLTEAWTPAISGDGRRVVAMAGYVNPPPPPPAIAAAAVPGDAVVGFDLAAVAPDGTVAAVRLDLDGAGVPIGVHLGGNRPLISHDGLRVVFEASVPLACGGCEFPPHEPRAFLAGADPDGDGAIGPSTTIEALSRDTAGEPVRAIMPAISGDGRYAAFVTDAPQTHNGVDQPSGDSSCAVPRTGVVFALAQVQSACQVVVRDLVLDAARAADGLDRLPGELASPSVLGDCSSSLAPDDTCASDGIAGLPAISGNGGVVAFASTADDLVPDDDNADQDVFARRFTPGLEAGAIDFGAVQVGDEVSLGTVVTPVGFGPLVVQSMTVQGVGFSLDTHTCGIDLHAGDSCVVSVAFAPTAEGLHTGSLLIQPAGLPPVPGQLVTVPLRGRATAFPQPDPAFVAEPDPLDFGERLTLSDSPPAAVTVRNGGERPLVITAVGLPELPTAADYRIVADACAGATLTAGASCTVTLVHRPLGPGARPAVLRIDQQTPVGLQPHLVQLLGAGTTPALQVNPAVVPVGRLTAVLGTGFPAGRVVSISMPGFPELVEATTDASGAFSAALMVYPNSVPGSRVVEAMIDGIGDSENLLVVPGTLGPPDFLARR